MVQIYFKDALGNKVTVEVTEAVADSYKEGRRAQWRSDSKARYHNASLDAIEEKGFQIKVTGVEDRLIADESAREKRVRIQKALAQLTEEQRDLIKKCFVQKIPLNQIAEQMGVTYQAIQSRIQAIRKKLKKYL